MSLHLQRFINAHTRLLPTLCTSGYLQSTAFDLKRCSAEYAMTRSPRYRLAVLSDLYFRPATIDEHGRARTEPTAEQHQPHGGRDDGTSTRNYPAKRGNTDTTGKLSRHEQLRQIPLLHCRKAMQRCFEEFAHPFERLEDDVRRCVRARYRSLRSVTPPGDIVCFAEFLSQGGGIRGEEVYSIPLIVVKWLHTK